MQRRKFSREFKLEAVRLVEERASLETKMASGRSSCRADSRPAGERPVNRTRAPSARSIFAVASHMPLVPPRITTFLSLYRAIHFLLAA